MLTRMSSNLCARWCYRLVCDSKEWSKDWSRNDKYKERMEAAGSLAYLRMVSTKEVSDAIRCLVSNKAGT